MNRILRRPMFRTGGSAEGITSGLAPRQRYNEAGKVETIMPGYKIDAETLQEYYFNNFDQLKTQYPTFKEYFNSMIAKFGEGRDMDYYKKGELYETNLKPYQLRADQMPKDYETGEHWKDTSNIVLGGAKNEGGGNMGTGGGNENTNNFLGMKVSDLGNMSLGQLQELSKAMAYKPRGTNVYDFMTEFGLDLLSRPKGGNIFQQVATSAKEPYSKYMERKKEADEQAYGSESDMFKTMMSGAFDVMAAEAESGTSAKQFDKENTARMISEWITSIDKNTKALENPDLSEDKRAELELQIQIDKTNLRNLKKKNIYAESILKSDKYVKGFVSTIMERLKKVKNSDGSPKYPDPDNNPDLYKDAYDEFVRYFEEEYATGGRVGYQMGGDVMPGQPMQAAMTTDQGPEAPPEVQNIDYETLRARLPSSITDDIVRLIANSPEAMEDFATIQTQQDINSFNEKYGVELVLPTEA